MQASVKQVQFLEKVEIRTGIHYDGTKWDQDEVSAYLTKYAKPKEESKPRSSNSQNQGYGNKTSNKITDKQKQYIKVLETKTGKFFNGKTFEDAAAFIQANKSV